MSDDEYEYEYDSDESGAPMDEDTQNDDDDDDQEFEYTDDDEDQEFDDVNVAMENEYYNAKGLKDSDINEALEKFENVIRMEKENNSNEDTNDVQWTFKALKQSMKIRLRNNEYDKARELYKRLLECITNPKNEGVSPNAVEKGLNGMLERVSALLFSGNSSSAMTDDNKSDGSLGPAQVLAWYVYDETLMLFHPQRGPCPNERLFFKTNLKYGQLLYENHQTSRLQSVIKELLSISDHNRNQSSSLSSTTSTSSTNLMEIYALQIQLYSRMKDHKKLREIYSKAMQVHGGIPHPRTIALIQELGGKMHMASREYESANTAFFQAFKSYDEAGDIARLRCLKYLVMASMLHASSINPFDSQEVRPYKEDPEIVAMTNLVDAFHNNDIEKFERILKKNEGRIMDDEFIREYLADLLRTIRMQVLQEVLRPYTRISINSISKKLNGIPTKDVENLLVTAILDGKLDGRIDQVNGILVKNVDSSQGGGAGSSANDADKDGKSETRSGSSVRNMDSGDGPTMPAWGENSISVRTCSAMENLMDQLERLTMAVTATDSKSTNQQLYSLMKAT
mmetsp:Transcript_1706/g.2437  ORF Transcript_1706/g.2437 Transcript_1706/m.2437 type:complete len:567 (-) Transcript_1706:147-1847(-)|eukprot:CAMPEP_0203664530 /NCGR_PEP_ID=MMETSP0090-20130426/1928_1 /ASSEMBLY_ACC=CAM_ASM_001088 /TAXON_ID=426623 /ORGANISM="Chaetoceros affinis, Strain CCMP159" /LENGTH=566 /DNA_ID=CAMNT_0050527809 /DNA_START=78 /DNA_END=1778 /DNA_ORIENTATION=+